jgi:hypothetical protein
MAEGVSQAIGIDLTAAVVSLVGNDPAILTVRGRESAPFQRALPSGPFAPLRHRTLELGLRGFVEDQTGFSLGYIEQLYTFGDRGRHATAPSSAPHFMSIGYLALTRSDEPATEEPSAGDLTSQTGAVTDAPWGWQGWYSFFPWEDWRAGRPRILDAVLLPALHAWLETPQDDEPVGRDLSRARRVAMAFGEDGAVWDEERVLERYEILYEAGLAPEAVRDGRLPQPEASTDDARFGVPMALDHRRILATAIARLRGKMKYRPVVFELMGESFTLTGLQLAVEAMSGRRLHKQNFRRLVDNAGLVEPTGATTQATGGRPAALYRFRRDIMAERPSAGLRFGQPVVR